MKKTMDMSREELEKTIEELKVKESEESNFEQVGFVRLTDSKKAIKISYDIHKFFIAVSTLNDILDGTKEVGAISEIVE